MNDLKRASGFAILFLVLLRMSIGWQFLYEGLWKLDTFDTPRPWSSAGYLKNAQGPLRDHFRESTGDPDDLQWLDYDAMTQRWDDWQTRFVAFYGLDETDQGRLEALIEGPKQHTASVEAIPEAAQEVLDDLKSVIVYDAEQKRLVVNGATPLKPNEAADLQATVAVVKVGDDYAAADEEGQARRDADGALIAPDPEELKFFQAIEGLERNSARMGYKQRLAATLRGDPDRVGVVAVYREDKDDYVPQMVPEAGAAATEDPLWIRYGEIEAYKRMLADYERAHEQASINYQVEHLGLLWQQIQDKRAELVGPVRALDTELRRDAQGLLDQAQLAKGELPPPRTQLWLIDQLTIWGLLILGALLLLGLCSRLAALAGAVMLVMFYLPFPPWPGVLYPPQLLGPEHSFIINKNLIEAIALLGIAALPTGRWFGVDALLRGMFGRKGSTRESKPRVTRA